MDIKKHIHVCIHLIFRSINSTCKTVTTAFIFLHSSFCLFILYKDFVNIYTQLLKAISDMICLFPNNQGPVTTPTVYMYIHSTYIFRGINV